MGAGACQTWPVDSSNFHSSFYWREKKVWHLIIQQRAQIPFKNLLIFFSVEIYGSVLEPSTKSFSLVNDCLKVHVTATSFITRFAIIFDYNEDQSMCTQNSGVNLYLFRKMEPILTWIGSRTRYKIVACAQSNIY